MTKTPPVPTMVMTRSSRISTAVFSSMPMPSRLGEFGDERHQPAVSAALVEVLVDDDVFQQAEPGGELAGALTRA